MWSPTARSPTPIVLPALVIVVELVTVMVRVQPSGVLSDRSDPLMAVIVMSPKPIPPAPPRPGPPRPKGARNPRTAGPRKPNGPPGPRCAPLLPPLPLPGAPLEFGAAVEFGFAAVLGSAPVAAVGPTAMTATTPMITRAATAARIPNREAETRPVPPLRTGSWNSISGSGIGASVNGPAGMFRRSKARVGGPVAPTVRVESSRVLRTGEGPQAYCWEPLSDVV